MLTLKSALDVEYNIIYTFNKNAVAQNSDTGTP